MSLYDQSRAGLAGEAAGMGATSFCPKGRQREILRGELGTRDITPLAQPLFLVTPEQCPYLPSPWDSSTVAG